MDQGTYRQLVDQVKLAMYEEVEKEASIASKATLYGAKADALFSAGMAKGREMASKVPGILGDLKSKAGVMARDNMDMLGHRASKAKKSINDFYNGYDVHGSAKDQLKAKLIRGIGTGAIGAGAVGAAGASFLGSRKN